MSDTYINGCVVITTSDPMTEADIEAIRATLVPDQPINGQVFIGPNALDMYKAFLQAEKDRSECGVDSLYRSYPVKHSTPTPLLNEIGGY